MAQEDSRSEKARKTIVYQAPGAENVTVARNVPYCDSEEHSLAMDVYYPPGLTRAARLPVVVFVAGYPDTASKAMMGCKLKEMGAYTSWGRAVAATGMAAIAYETDAPAADIHELLAHIRQNASSLGIDENKIAIWSCSGNVPVALSVLMQKSGEYLKCAVLYYGFMLDNGKSSAVMDAAKRVGFANPSAGKTIDDLSHDVPMLVARAGQDHPGLNETIDRFLGEAMARNMPVTCINYPGGLHAFDLLDDSEMSREIIRQTLAFMQFHLG